MNKRGMLANLIGAFVVLLVGLTVIPTIVNQISLSMCTGATSNVTTASSVLLNSFSSGTSSYEEIEEPAQPNGKTGSFGGAGGSYKFGGYDGEVSHREWNPVKKVQKATTRCIDSGMSSTASSILTILPTLFALAIMTAIAMIVFSSLSNAGVV